MADSVISPSWSLSKQLPPRRTIITGVILVFLVWAFVTKRTLQFYASALFFFYSITHSMWISVVLLGVFQTLLLVPFRIINVTRSRHIKDFEETIVQERDQQEQSFLIKKSTKTGNKVILYYLVNFMVFLTSYVSIGRLFLTDFYTKRLDPKLLFDFIQYPSYPLKDVWFKIPYLKFEQTKDLGFSSVLVVWGVILIIAALFSFIRRYLAKQKITPSGFVMALLTGSTVLAFVISYFFLRNFPTAVDLAIFTGDISKPLPALNLITALATFFTLFWLDLPSIMKKGELAIKANIDAAIIRKTQSKLFSDSLKNAAIVGAGAYFITNRIPCAFELSIFTLEIISWVSPLTLDRLILKTNKPAEPKE